MTARDCQQSSVRSSAFQVVAVLISFAWLLTACDRGEEITQEKLKNHEPSEAAMAQFGPVVRTDLASITISAEPEKPQVLKLMREMLEPGETMGYAGAERAIVQVSGTQSVTVEGRTTTLKPDEGLHIGVGLPAEFTAQGEQPSVALHYLLVPEPQADRPIEVRNGKLEELYRTEPVARPDDKQHVLTLTHLTIPAMTPETKPQVADGAALYHVISGTGQLTSDDKADAHPPGTTVYQPAGMVHQWSNSGSEPLTLVAATIAPEGGTTLQFDTAHRQDAAPRK